MSTTDSSAATYRLYGFGPSGNTHKIRMLMGVLNLPFEEIAINLKAGEHRQPAFLAINPKGQVPALQTPDGLIIDSHAMLCYLARKHGGQRWWPDDALALARIMEWVSFSANEIHNGLASLRKHKRLGVPIPVEHCERVAHDSLKLMNQHLTHSDWLCGTAASIADICCLPYVAMAADAGIDVRAWPAVYAWILRCRTIPQLPWMPGMLEQ